MHPIRLGSYGWSYADWSGAFYPKGMQAGEFLSFYAERFLVVEVDSTFYRSPSPKMVQGWRDKTPEGFGFSLKVPQTITHEKCLLDCRKDVDLFVSAARALKDKLLCCLLQFGYFNRKAFADLGAFLERLDAFLAEWPKDVAVAVEIRNKNWMVPELAECFRRHGAVWALADQAWMPSPLNLVENFDVVTGPFGYLRLIGDRAEVDKLTKKLDHIVIDRSDQIKANAKAIKQIATRVPVVTFINSHFAGYAPETLEQLRKRLGIKD